MTSANVGDDAPLRFGHFEIHPAERMLRVGGAPVTLGSRAFDVLLALARRHDRVVTKQELLDLVWPGLVVEEHNIATQIGNLRKLLGAGAITTLPGRGYRLTSVPEAACQTPAASPADPPTRHNLPQPRTRFIGRDAALSGLARLLPATRLLTLTGIGGCGKTRLALRFGQQQLAVFPDGVWFVDLAPLKQSERVVSACAAVLGLRESGDTPLLARLIAHLAPRRSLLLLDNCEQVIDGVAGLAESLLAGADGTTILATSREALKIGGEQIYPVRSLSLPATDDLPAVLGAESARVFVDRARLALPDFEPDAASAAPIAEICRRLDGIALAIELAAARVTMLSVAQIAERLDDRFRLLTGGSRALPRHQTLQAAMQWSYEQLATLEQRFLRLMSVFVGGWTLRAAADVAAIDDEYDTLALLTALRDKSLLVVDRDTADGQPRYRMLETVRQYALDRLAECGEADAARGRHAAHCVVLAEEAEPHWRGPDQDLWTERIRLEHDNLIAALAWCCEGQRDARSGLRIAAAMSFYWVWNEVELGHRLARAALDSDRAAADTPERVGSLICIARLSMFRGHYDESRSYAEQGVAAARRLDDSPSIALALSALGSALETMGRFDESLRHQEEGLERARKAGSTRLMSLLLNSIAEARRGAGQLDAADRCYREALESARAHGGRFEMVLVLDNLIRVQVLMGRPDQARRFAIECLPLARDEKVGVDLLDAVAGLASHLGEHETAARFWAVSNQKLAEWGYKLQPQDVIHAAPLIKMSRRVIGDPAFDAADVAGRALELDAAMQELTDWLARER